MRGQAKKGGRQCPLCDSTGVHRDGVGSLLTSDGVSPLLVQRGWEGRATMGFARRGGQHCTQDEMSARGGVAQNQQWRGAQPQGDSQKEFDATNSEFDASQF